MSNRKKWFAITGCIIILLLGTGVTMMLFPNPLFAHKERYKSFTVYAENPIHPNYKDILERSLRLASQSELYDSGCKYDILLNEGSWYKEYTQAVLGPAPARNIDNNILLNSHVDFENAVLGTSHNKRDLVQTITHEMVHCLQLNKYGMLKQNPIHHPPIWKLEGYPEYIAYLDVIQQDSYNFELTVNQLRSFVSRGQEWIELRPRIS
jgi:hypothetical protein